MVDDPLGLTVPLKVAEVDVTALAEIVVAAGAERGGAEVVVNVRSFPFVVPAPLVPFTLK